jgi:PEP-CTERM motif
MIKKIARTLSMFVFFVLAATLLLSSSAQADTISLNLTSPVQSGTAGSTLSFLAAVSAPLANSGTVFLVGDNFNQSTGLTINDDGFFVGFPLSLNAGDSFNGLLYTVTLDPSLVSGLYTGFFQILGGVTDVSQDVLATVNYSINVGSTPSAVPEPESLMLLATGLPGLAFFVRSKRHVLMGRKA